MRILFVVHQFMPEFSAGTERVTYTLAKAAQRDGHRVEVATCSVLGESHWAVKGRDGTREASVDGIPVHAFPGDGLEGVEVVGLRKNPAIRTWFERFLDKRESYDLVHVMHSMRMVDAVEVVRERGLPYVVTLTDFFLACYRINLVRPSGELCPGPNHGHNCETHCPLPGLGGALFRERYNQLRDVLQSAAEVVACSGYVAEVFKTEFPHLSVRVIEHGIDLLRFGRRPNRQDAELVFGFLGTLSESKGVHILAEAFAAAAPAAARLEIVGPCYEPEFRKRLDAIADRTAHMTIRPPVGPDALASTLGGFSVLCVPSQVPETFSLVQQEGFASGLPSLVSDLGNPARVVREHRCGRTVPPRDIQAWAQAISQIAAQPGILRDWRANLPLPRRHEEEGFTSRSCTVGLQCRPEPPDLRGTIADPYPSGAPPHEAVRSRSSCTTAPSVPRGAWRPLRRRFLAKGRFDAAPAHPGADR